MTFKSSVHFPFNVVSFITSSIGNAHEFTGMVLGPFFAYTL